MVVYICCGFYDPIELFVVEVILLLCFKEECFNNLHTSMCVNTSFIMEGAI
jgi:hypothetical protein